MVHNFTALGRYCQSLYSPQGVKYLTAYLDLHEGKINVFSPSEQIDKLIQTDHQAMSPSD